MSVPRLFLVNATVLEHLRPDAMLILAMLATLMPLSMTRIPDSLLLAPPLTACTSYWASGTTNRFTTNAFFANIVAVRPI